MAWKFSQTIVQEKICLFIDNHKDKRNYLSSVHITNKMLLRNLLKNRSLTLSLYSYWIRRYSGPLVEGFTDSTNQSITGSYVDFSRDYYTPNIQNASNFLIQSTLVQRGETPTYV